MTRRRFGAIAGGALASAFGACRSNPAAHALKDDGRIAARPRPGVTTVGAGTRELKLGGRRDGIVQLPSKLRAGPIPLVVMLHGAGGSAAGILRRVGTLADEAGVAVLAPDSRDGSWDAIRGGFGPDVDFLNRALERVFESVSVDPGKVAIGGFSDGATYAVSLGLINGDLFRRVVAFSPGFIVDGPRQGNPRFFISHGTGDRVLPIDRCSRVIVRQLQQRGYDVTFREFAGGHEVPPEIGREGLRWAAG